MDLVKLQCQLCKYTWNITILEQNDEGSLINHRVCPLCHCNTGVVIDQKRDD